MQGEYFDFKTASTFEDEASAREYAERFARRQGEAGIYGARIDVRARRGDATLAVYRSEDYLVQAAADAD